MLGCPPPGWPRTRPTGRTTSSGPGVKRRRIGYVLAVPRSQTIPAGAGSSRADHAVAGAPDQAWKRRSCAEGAKGPRLFDWAVATVSSGEHTPAGWGRWLLVRRQILTTDQVEASNRSWPSTCAPARPAPPTTT